MLGIGCFLLSKSGKVQAMENENHYKSRTKKKKEAEELQKLGLELSTLSVQQLIRINIPENLRTALIDGKSITSNIAGRRHRQFIGALMRDVDPDIIHKALLEAKDEAAAALQIEKSTWLWIDRLLFGNTTDIETLISEYPGLERQRLKQLIRNIKNAKNGSKATKARKALEQLILNQIRP